jgi:hypothetical protein
MTVRIVLACAGFALLAATAHARVYGIQPVQTLEFPNPDGVFGPPRVAIDGDAAIALLDTAAGREAVLLRLDAAGVWEVDRTLLRVTAPATSRNELDMRDGKAAVLLDDVLHIFERTADGAWIEAATAGTPLGAGAIAVSGTRIVVGRLGCNAGANVFEKSLGSGVWRITGRIPGSNAPCNVRGTPLDVHEGLVIVRDSEAPARVFRHTGAYEWPEIERFVTGNSLGDTSPALAGTRALFDYGYVWGADSIALDHWTPRGVTTALNVANGARAGLRPNWRDGFALLQMAEWQPHDDAHVYVFVDGGGIPDTAHMRHHAVLRTPGYANQSDVSGHVVVAASQGFGGERFVSFFQLPPAAVPAAYVNDFHSTGGEPFAQLPGSQFAIASAGSGAGGGVFRQSSLAGDAQAWLPHIDWSYAQSVEAHITPTAVDGADRWVGLAVRYVDADQHYYVTLRSSGVIQLKRKVAGAYATLASAPLPFAIGARRHVRLVVNGARLTVEVDGVQRLAATDHAISHGSVALLTYRARADFDDLYASPTAPFTLATRDFTQVSFPGIPFMQMGGT